LIVPMEGLWYWKNKMAKRIQRKRTKSWKMPVSAIYVGRPTKWGNPFNWQDYIDQWHTEGQAKSHATWLYYGWLRGKVNQWQLARDKILKSLDELRGFDLACWCDLSESCHTDVLLELANE
jgi:hypothetical protein